LYLVAIVLSVLLWYAASDYPSGILWPLYCLFFFDIRLLITPLVSCGHCIVCSSLIYGFWLHLWYLVAIVLSVLLWYTDSDYTFCIFKVSFFPHKIDVRIQITKNGIEVKFLVLIDHCFPVMYYDDLVFYLTFNCWLQHVWK
jgi:hypothetical protein